MTLSLSLSTGCLAHLPLRLAFRFAHEAGFDGLELVRTPAVAISGAGFVRRLSQQYNLPILSVHPSVIPYPGYDRATKVLPELVALAELTDSPLVVIHTPKEETLDHPKGRQFVDTLLRESERAKPRVRITLENAGFYRPADKRYWLHDIGNLRSLADLYDLPLTFDTSHAGTTPLGLEDSYRLLRDRVVNVHFSDLRPRHLPPDWRPLYTILAHHQMPGEGTLPLSQFVLALLRHGYRGPLTFELSPVALGGWSPPQITRRLRQSIQFVRQIESSYTSHA